jgi:hypothetical protein
LDVRDRKKQEDGENYIMKKFYTSFSLPVIITRAMKSRRIRQARYRLCGRYQKFLQKNFIWET